MQRYTKQDVQHHSTFGGRSLPAVNVKVHWCFRESDIQEHFRCPPAEAERVSRIIWECQCEDFWRYWTEDEGGAVRETLGDGLKVYSEGRSDGWLVVDGLPDVETWDAKLLAKWRKFEKMVRADVDWRMDREQAIELAEINEWVRVSDIIPTLHAIA